MLYTSDSLEPLEDESQSGLSITHHLHYCVQDL